MTESGFIERDISRQPFGYIPSGGILCSALNTPTGYLHGRSGTGCMRDETQRKADARLARIEGQIRAVRKMVTEDRYCIDVVRQVQAARSALSLSLIHI